MGGICRSQVRTCNVHIQTLCQAQRHKPDKFKEPAPPILPTLQNQTTTITQTTTMTTITDTPCNHHTEALHLTRNGHWQYHWFNPHHFPPPSHAATWKPSCNDKGCRHWDRCYDCNNFSASLLVDKAEFLAQKQLEQEYPETPHPNHHHFAPTTSTTEQTLKMKIRPQKEERQQLASNKRSQSLHDCT
jgi:hypothetical protein